MATINNTSSTSVLLDTSQNALILDVFLVKGEAANHSGQNGKSINESQSQSQQQQLFLALADLAVALNAYFQEVDSAAAAHSGSTIGTRSTTKRRYPWLSGGDGVVFGMHCSLGNDDVAAIAGDGLHYNHTSTSDEPWQTQKSQQDVQLDPNNDCNDGNGRNDGISTNNVSTKTTTRTTTTPRMIPHLRAVCRYGVSVADEWHAIQLLLQFVYSGNGDYHMLTECWDVDDGQILLVEAANHLPDWIDQIGPEQCRHRCWIWHYDPCRSGISTGESRPTKTDSSFVSQARIHFIQPTDHTARTTGGSDGHGNDTGNDMVSSPSLGLSLQQALDVWRQWLFLLHNHQSSSKPLGMHNNSITVASDQVHEAIYTRATVDTSSAAASTTTMSLHSNDSKPNCDSPDPVNDQTTTAPLVLPEVRARYHRAAVALPRAVAHLLAQRPDLIAPACRMFVDQALNDNYNCNGATSIGRRGPERTSGRGKSSSSSGSAEAATATTATPYLAGMAHDWVWTTLPFSRTAYAMLRTVTSAPHWTTEQALHPPSVAANIQVKQLRRTCAVESTPHLKYGLALGVRLVAGLDACLQHSDVCVPPDLVLPHDTSLAERRVTLYWSNLWQTCAATDQDVPNRGHSQQTLTDNWIVQAWLAGPNHARHNLASMVHCPVYEPEVVHSLTPLTCPNVDIAQQIRRELVRKRKQDNDDILDQTTPPLARDVDDEAWLWSLPTSDNAGMTGRQVSFATPQASVAKTESAAGVEGAQTNTDPSSVDTMLQGVQSFLAGQSSVDGVDNTTNNTTAATAATSTGPKEGDSLHSVSINPTVFLNLLHATLEAPSVEVLSAILEATDASSETAAGADSETNDGYQQDPFFSQEDYDLMMPSRDGDDGESSDDVSQFNENPDVDLQSVMNAMDAELRETALSREWDNGNRDRGDDQRVAASGDVASSASSTMDMHVVSNLLQSLSNGHGGPGPLQNILQEMRIQAPDVLHDDGH